MQRHAPLRRARGQLAATAAAIATAANAAAANAASTAAATAAAATATAATVAAIADTAAATVARAREAGTERQHAAEEVVLLKVAAGRRARRVHEHTFRRRVVCRPGVGLPPV